MFDIRVMTMADYDAVIDLMRGAPGVCPGTLAASYWHNQGWQLRTDIDRYSFTRSNNENA